MKSEIRIASLYQRGISLIEAVLYLVIALAVIVGGIIFFQQAQLSNKVTDMARISVSLSSEIRALYDNQRTFGTEDMTEALVMAGAVPSNLVSSTGDGTNTAILHPFGSLLSITGTGDQFSIRFDNMREDACVRLGLLGESSSGPLGIGIASISFFGLDTTPRTIVSPANAAELCQKDADGNLAMEVRFTR